MKILRMEAANGQGPFHTDFGVLVETYMAEGYTVEDHPGPERDGIRDFSWDDVLGCVSARQFVSWFPRAIRKVLRETDHGYVVAEYACPDNLVKVGRHQCAFPKDRATLLHSRPI